MLAGNPDGLTWTAPPAPGTFPDADEDELHDELQELWNRSKAKFSIDEDAWMRMPAFMDKITEQDVLTNPDVAALQSVLYDETSPLDLAIKLKNSGNTNLGMALKNGNTHLYTSAIEFYTEALAQKAEDNTLNGTIFSNRAQAHLYRENYASALKDAQRAMLLLPNHAKSYYRAILAAIHLKKLTIADELLHHVDTNDHFESIRSEPEWCTLREKVKEQHERVRQRQTKEQEKVQEKKSKHAQTLDLMKQLGIQVGPAEVESHQWAQYGEGFLEQLTLTHEAATKEGIPCNEVDYCFPILFLYDEYSQSDFIQATSWFCTIQEQLLEMFPGKGNDNEYPPWDTKRRYHCDNLCVFYQDSNMDKRKVNVGKSLQQIFQSKGYVMPAMLPTFHVLPRDSEYVKQWTSSTTG